MSAAAPEGALGPLIGTITALGDIVQVAGAGTGLFAFALVILTLEFLRESKGFMTPLARLLVIGALTFSAAAQRYGDFLAEPAKAALAMMRAEAAPVGGNALLWTGLGAVGAGLTFYAGMQSGAAASARANQGAARPGHRFVSVRSDSQALRVSDLGRGLSLDIAGRLQLRALTRNPKKPPARAVKPALKTFASLHQARG